MTLQIETPRNGISRTQNTPFSLMVYSTQINNNPRVPKPGYNNTDQIEKLRIEIEDVNSIPRE